MKRIFGGWTHKSDLLSDAMLQAWLIDAEILESDGFGIKVARLRQGNILKIFRVKRWFSSAQLYSYARRFCRNAQRLALLDVPTVKVQHLYHCEDKIRSVVVYAPLEGVTALQMLNAQTLDNQHAQALGAFIADLHDKGIYFRGLHLGNIVLTPEDRFGLIDVSEMTIFPWRLGCRRRFRNFARFWRTFEDKYAFGYQGIHALIQGYHGRCRKVEMKLKEIERHLM
jgi:tRNA A-37 threonylcarbamoyl transferase component Bud32